MTKKSKISGKTSKVLGDVFPPPYDLQQSIERVDAIVNKCVAIGISPSDTQLKQPHLFINIEIKKVLKRFETELFHIVGEWSTTNHRWHYHGVIQFKDMSHLDRVRRSLNRNVGRTVVEQIKDTQMYNQYMHKIYKEPLLLNTVQPFKPDSYIAI